MWIVIILAELYIVMTYYFKFRRLGSVIIANKSKSKLFMINAFIFLILMIQNIISYIHYGALYLIIAIIGLFMGIITLLFTGTRQIAIYENGLVNERLVLKWDNIRYYTWLSVSNNEAINLVLLANYKVLLWNFYNKEIKLTIKKDDVERIQNILDSNKIEKKTI